MTNNPTTTIITIRLKYEFCPFHKKSMVPVPLVIVSFGVSDSVYVGVCVGVGHWSLWLILLVSLKSLSFLTKTSPHKKILSSCTSLVHMALYSYLSTGLIWSLLIWDNYIFKRPSSAIASTDIVTWLAFSSYKELWLTSQFMVCKSAKVIAAY